MSKKRAWVLTVDMGYGHQRAAYPLKDIAYGRVISANNDDLVSAEEQKRWKKTQDLYEGVSRMKDVPILGAFTFGVYDQFQKISPFFPFRDLSKPNYTVLLTKHQIVKKGYCDSLIEEIKKTKYPIVCTHFAPALACEYLGVKNKIYCLLTDTDSNRIWVTDKPRKSKIIYLAPCRHDVVRMREYGVPEKNILLTGFPLPKENIGGRNCNILKHDLGYRLPNLDPKKKFMKQREAHIKRTLGRSNYRLRSNHPLTITYLVGGAGAQKEIGVQIAKSLAPKIKKGEIRLNLVAGVRLEISSYFNHKLKRLGLADQVGKNIKIFFTFEKENYFSDLNKALRTTDILWTKPSELSFYTALGFPVILTPPVGAHEEYNRQWLEHIGSAFLQEDPRYVNDWLYYWLESGRFAQGAMDGFLEAPTLGTYNIEDLVVNNKKTFSRDSIYY
jgi:hypothetical protein